LRLTLSSWLSVSVNDIEAVTEASASEPAVAVSTSRSVLALVETLAAPCSVSADTFSVCGLTGSLKVIVSTIVSRFIENDARSGCRASATCDDAPIAALFAMATALLARYAVSLINFDVIAIKVSDSLVPNSRSLIWFRSSAGIANSIVVPRLLGVHT
jgi:hypothetical protein